MTPATPLPRRGTTLIVGPLGSGKTSLTAEALTDWLEREGPDGTVVLDFAPEIETVDGVIGGRLDRVLDIPDDVWVGTIEAHGPRFEGADPAAVARLASANADRSRRLLAGAPPSPRAVFANDVTIAFQHEPDDVASLQRYCSGAECVVVNAYEGDELGRDDPVSGNEARAVELLRGWADRVLELGEGRPR